MPSDSVRNLSAQIFSSTAIIVSWDPPLEPNGRPHYLLTLQEASPPEDASNPESPAVNKTIKHTTTDTVFLFTKLKKYFPYVLTVIPATGAGPAYNHTSTMYLRTDDDGELIFAIEPLWFMALLWHKHACGGVSLQFLVLLPCWCSPGTCHHPPSLWHGNAL